MQSIGRGAGAAKTFCAVMNPLKFNLHTAILLDAATEICNTSLINIAAFDGLWQKCDH